MKVPYQSTCHILLTHQLFFFPFSLFFFCFSQVSSRPTKTTSYQSCLSSLSPVDPPLLSHSFPDLSLLPIVTGKGSSFVLFSHPVVVPSEHFSYYIFCLRLLFFSPSTPNVVLCFRLVSHSDMSGSVIIRVHLMVTDTFMVPSGVSW